MAFPQNSTLIDDFNRADGAVYAGGGSGIWSADDYLGNANALNVSSNQLASSGGAVRGMTVVTLPTDKEIVISCPTVTSGTIDIVWSIASAGSSAWTGYFLEYDQSIGWDLWRKNTGSSSGLDNANIPIGGAPTLVNGDKIGIYHVNGVIRVRRYTAGAWVPTPILEVTGETTFTNTGALAVVMPNTWRLDDLIGYAAIEEDDGGDGGGPDDGPATPLTLTVDADAVSASDGWTRAEVFADDTLRFLTMQAAAMIARAGTDDENDPGVPWGDTILVEPATNANPADAIDTSVYAGIDNNLLTTNVLPFADNSANAPILVKGNGTISDDTAPKLWRIQARGLKNWHFEDFQQGYDRVTSGDHDEANNVSVCSNVGDLEFRRFKYTGGGFYITGHTGELLWEDCEVYSPFSVFAGGGNRFLDGAGFHIIHIDTTDGTEYQGNVTFRRCHFEDIDGEDAIQIVGGSVALGNDLTVEACEFRDIAQGQDANAAHTDCIQLLGGGITSVTGCSFLNCDSPFIASDAENEMIVFENNLIDGGGVQLQGQGTREWRVFHNTFRNGGFGLSVAFGGRTEGVTQKIFMVNNVMEDFSFGDAVVHADSTVKNNVLTRHPGFTTAYGTNLPGLPEFGSSDRLTDAGITESFELATVPVVSAGIGQGAIDVSNLPTADFFGRAFANPPDVGALQSDDTEVGPTPRAPYVTATFPTGESVEPDATVLITLYPKPGEEIDPATVDTGSAWVTDVTNFTIPAVVTLGAIDDGFQTITVDLKTTLTPVTEGFLFPLVLYTTHFNEIADTEGSVLPAVSWQYRIVGSGSPAIRDSDGNVISPGHVPLTQSGFLKPPFTSHTPEDEA